MTSNFEGSHDLANKYMKVSRNSERVMNLPEDSPVSLRGALEEIKRAEGKERRRQRDERKEQWRADFRETARQAAIQQEGGYVSVALRMEASHAYDFERPGEPVRFAACERLWDTGFLAGSVDWDNEPNVYYEEEVPVLEPTETDFIAARHRRGPTFHVFNPAFGVREPALRPLSLDGNRLLLPTGHWEAAHYKGEMRRWWEWDVLDESDGREILKAADRKHYKAAWMEVHSLTDGLSRPGYEWLSSTKLEAALLADLGAVRARRASEKPDLTDARVVYEIGERALTNSGKRRRAWKRFAAFVQDGGAA